MNPKRQMKEKYLQKTLLYAKMRLWSQCAWIMSIRLACAGAREKAIRQKGENKEERSHKKCISHVCMERPLARRFQPNLACVRLTDVIKHGKFHRYNLRGFGAVWCWSFHVAIRNPTLTHCFALPCSRWLVIKGSPAGLSRFNGVRRSILLKHETSTLRQSHHFMSIDYKFGVGDYIREITSSAKVSSGPMSNRDATWGKHIRVLWPFLLFIRQQSYSPYPWTRFRAH